MGVEQFSLDDKFNLEKQYVLLNGTQALVRLMLAQKERDRVAGHNTAGFVTGYRGSPLGAVDFQMQRAAKELKASEITFQEGLNEDLAATALWGSQQAELRGQGKYDGVFGLWYGKGPGVDRSGDVMRHANMAGSSALGGVIMAMGDDHTGESSTVLHQSDWAMVDASMPVLSPAGVQEILDFGHYAYALSRYTGLWAGLKVMKDTIEVTSVVDGDPHRMGFVTPDFDLPQGGLNIRLVDTPTEQEARLIRYKKDAAEAFARVNRMDKRIWGKPGAKIGFMAAGKNWLDLVHALSLLNIDESEAERLGITTYKVAQTWPLDRKSFVEWAEGLDLIVIVEEKRKLIEGQAKDAIFDNRQGRRIFGAQKGASGERLFHDEGALDPVMIAEHLGKILVEEGCSSEAVLTGLASVDAARRADNATDVAARIPYFCAGCPHNSSTKVPDGSRAYAGIGCHFMVQWMDRSTLGFTHMGGEGANWMGEAPFSKTDHVFQNIGDGTYNHSGIQAIRAAVAAGTNITYKVLFNDAVAMTGGQGHDGGLSAPQIARELLAMGVKDVALVYDDKEAIDLAQFPKEITRNGREDLMTVQERLAEVKGVSALLYVQTCAAEKRRRRKRGKFPDPDKRIFINTDVCEGCGDCGVQSNCVAITPVETEFGRKRAIDQSACNKDFSCLNGFCPSFVTVEGAKVKKADTIDFDLPQLSDPQIPEINGTYNIVVTGIGGTGVVTIGALLAQAAHIDGKGAGMMEMAGLAQKGGAVMIHCRLANRPEDISAIRVATGECDSLIGGDLVVSAGAKTLGLTTLGRTKAVVNSHEIITGDFTRNTDFQLPTDQLSLSLEARLKDDLSLFDASELSRIILGDSIFSNMMVFGAAWQRGMIPLSYAAIIRSIELNGAAVEMNKRAFDLGRWAIEYHADAAKILASEVIELPKSLDEKIAYRFEHLVKYQNQSLGMKYRSLVDSIADVDVKEAVAFGYHKLLSYKDEFEVARLHLDTFKKASETFDNVKEVRFHLAPPILAGTLPNGRPKKREFGSWMIAGFKLLAKLKALRNTPFNVFGYSEERKMERALITEYERDMKWAMGLLNDANKVHVIALAKLPLEIRGFGPVKLANVQSADTKRKQIKEMILKPSVADQTAAQ